MRYGILTDREQELLIYGLSPEPTRPRIIELGGTPQDAVPGGTPVTRYASGTVITNWLCASPIPLYSERVCVRLDRGLREPEWAEEAAEWIEQLRPLGRSCVEPESYPDYTEAIDLLALAGGEQNQRALLVGALETDTRRLVRVSHGCAGEGVSLQMLVDGVSVPHDGYVRLAPGLHLMILEACNGETERVWQWPERRISPRFDDISEDDIDGIHAWRHSRWERSLRMARTPEDEAVTGVEIDPNTLKGTPGFIRVGKSTNGVYWLVDPEDKPFYYRAICSVNNSPGPGGRRKAAPLAPEDQVQGWITTMKHWGFNGLGSWTTREFFDKGMVFTEILESFYDGPYVQDGAYRHGVLPDVFDPEWERRLQKRCAQLCAPLTESRELLGYFIDNERGFMTTRVPEGASGPIFRVGDVTEIRRQIVEAEPVENAEQLGLLQLLLSVDPKRPGARKAWEFISAKYGDGFSRLSEAWGVSLESPVSLNEMTVNGERLMSDAYLDDERAFMKVWVEQYFRVCVGAIKKHDPNHLIIGLRWAGIPDRIILEEETKWCDIVSMNHYRAKIVEIFDPVFQEIQAPILIGECEPTNDSFQFVMDPIEPPGGYASPTARCETRLYECMDRVFAHPGIVGYTYYAWKYNSQHPEKMKPVRQANRRATCIHTESDRPAPTGPFELLHGQIHVTVILRGRQSLELGLLCDHGEWQSIVRGNAIQGKVTKAAVEGDRSTLEVELKLLRGMFAGSEGEATLRLVLNRISPDQLEGTSDGTINGVERSGMIKAYVHREHLNPLV